MTFIIVLNAKLSILFHITKYFQRKVSKTFKLLTFITIHTKKGYRFTLSYYANNYIHKIC